MKTATETIQRDIIIGDITPDGDLPEKNQDTMTAEEYYYNREKAFPTVFEAMESYAQQVADEQKAALKKRIEERISEHQSILAVLEVEEIGYQETAQTATTIIAVYETILYEIETLSQI